MSFASADLEQSSPFSSSVSLLLSLSLPTCYLLLGGLCSAFALFFWPLFSAFFLRCFLVVVVGDVLGFELVLCVLSSFVAFSL